VPFRIDAGFLGAVQRDKEGAPGGIGGKQCFPPERAHELARLSGRDAVGMEALQAANISFTSPCRQPSAPFA
jgi:hypothetical protein